jgi:uncharacterized DUF497 family protein
MLTFTWDERKDAANRTKHGISFDEARTVFFDEHARLIADPDHSDDEDRFIILGHSEQRRLLVVCHCYREDDSIVRIISARKAMRSEADNYRSFRK